MSSRRYEGVLRPSASTHWPNRVLCVDTVECETAEWSDTHGHVPDLLYWRAIPLVRVGGRYEYCSMWEGDNEEQWWGRLHGLCERGQSLLVLSANCQNTWPMLGLWRQLESGQLRMVSDGFDPLTPEQYGYEPLCEDIDDSSASFSAGYLRTLTERHTGYICLGNPPMIARLKLRDTDCWITFVDVANYSVNAPGFTPRGERMAQWIAAFFCKYSAMCRENRLGAWKPTIGGQAYEGWRYGYYTGGAVVSGYNHVGAIESAGYIGGRCEAWRLGEITGQVTYLDIRAAYCSICSATSVPVRIVSIHHGRECVTILAGQQAYNCAAKVTVRTYLPIYPYRMGAITVWPVGEFETTLCGAELATAVDRGHIVAWHSMVRYHCLPILAEYARAMYSLREQCESAQDAEMSTVAKLLCNCIVGSMARRQKEWVTCARDGNDLLWGEWYGANESGERQRYRSLGGNVQREIDTGFVDGALPAIAMWITAACRMQLWRYIEIAGKENVYYGDTDALMVSDSGVEHLGRAGTIAEGAIGQLGVRWVSDDVAIHGIKHYRHGDNVVCAGLHTKDKAGVCDGEQYYYAMSPQDEIRSKAAPSGRVIVKRYSRDEVYRHGVVAKDGSVSPIVTGV